MTPWDGEASWAKVASAMSTTRPAAYGPRDTTTQVTEWPVAVSVTVMTAPMGAALLAQVPVGMVASQVP